MVSRETEGRVIRMELCGISERNQQIEREIMEKLFACIDTNESTVFNSGAGAGKTYALIECLKYIVNKYGKSLNDHNQHVICITYTNVAVNHIKEKLGNSDIVKVSTTVSYTHLTLPTMATV